MEPPPDPTFLELLTRHQLTLDQFRARGRVTPQVAARRAEVVRALHGGGRGVGEVCAMTGLTPTGVRRLLRAGPATPWSRDLYRAAVFGRATGTAGFSSPEELPLELPYVVVRGVRKGGGWGYLVAAPSAVLEGAAQSLNAFKTLLGEGAAVRVLTGQELGLEP